MSKSSSYSNCNNYNESEESVETVKSSNAEGAQNQLDFQDSVTEKESFADKQESQSAVPSLDDYPIPVNIILKPKNLDNLKETEYSRKCEKSSLSNTVELHCPTLDRLSKLKVLKNEISKPLAIQYPPGCKNEAQVEQRAAFALEQYIMNRIKERKYHFYKAYCERRRALGLTHVPDHVAQKVVKKLKKNLKVSMMESKAKRKSAKIGPLSEQPKFKIYQEVIHISEDNYEDDSLKKGIAKYDFPVQRAPKKSPNPAEFFIKLIFLDFAESFSQQDLDDNPDVLKNTITTMSPELAVGLAVTANKLKSHRVNRAIVGSYNSF